MAKMNSRSSEAKIAAGSTQPPADAAIAAPADDTEARGRLLIDIEISNELWTVRALVNSLHDSLDYEKEGDNRVQRVLRVIDERLGAIHDGTI